MRVIKITLKDNKNIFNKNLFNLLLFFIKNGK